jgi:hypothetical protein
VERITTDDVPAEAESNIEVSRLYIGFVWLLGLVTAVAIVAALHRDRERRQGAC